MAKYYGVVRSEEYLSHYGIKGMKWGVQKAKAAGNADALSKQYAKASKKLTKLKNKADLNYQLEKIGRAGRWSFRCRGSGRIPDGQEYACLHRHGST